MAVKFPECVLLTILSVERLERSRTASRRQIVIGIYASADTWIWGFI